MEGRCMSDDWQVGDLAVCVEARKSPLNAGSIYTVSAVLFDPASNSLGGFSNYTLQLVGITPSMRSAKGFCETRFRKIRPDAHEGERQDWIDLLKVNTRKPKVEA